MKNINKLINAFKDKQFHRKITLLVITNSSPSSVENEISRDLNSELISLTVKYNASEDEKFDLLKQTKMYVSLSKDENFSIAAMEAASMGCALLLSDYSFFRDIYGDASIYVSEDSSNDIWNYITRVLDNPNILMDYSHKAAKVASKYLVGNVARKDYDMILKRVTGKGIEN